MCERFRHSRQSGSNDLTLKTGARDVFKMTTAFSVLQGPRVLSNSNRFLKITTDNLGGKLPV